MWLIGETSEKDHFNVYRIGLAMSAVASAGVPAPRRPERAREAHHGLDVCQGGRPHRELEPPMRPQVPRTEITRQFPPNGSPARRLMIGPKRTHDSMLAFAAHSE